MRALNDAAEIAFESGFAGERVDGQDTINNLQLCVLTARHNVANSKKKFKSPEEEEKAFWSAFDEEVKSLLAAIEKRDGRPPASR